jgi:hypothetical protein
MPEFGQPVSEELRLEVLEAIKRLISDCPTANVVRADDYVLEPADAIVIDHAVIHTEDGDVDLNLCRPEWYPPFEWLAEVTSDLPGADYLKHYLIRDKDIVLAHRRDLTVIDDAEAELILADLQIAAVSLSNLA